MRFSGVFTSVRATTAGGWVARANASRVLDPLERTCEILFGVIVVLTFTRSISIAEADRANTRTVLVAAIACNLAWGIVDAAMYLLASFSERSRRLARLARSARRPSRTSPIA